MNPSQFNFPFCVKHNLEARHFQEPTQQYLCDVCIQEVLCTTNVQTLYAQKRQLLQQFDGKDEENKKIFEQFVLELVALKQKFEKQVKNVENIIGQVNYFKGQQQESKEQLIKTNYTRPAEIISEHEKYINQQNLFQINIQQQLENIKKDLIFYQLFENLNRLDSSSLNLPEEPTPEKNQVQKQNQEIIQQYTLVQNQSFLKQDDKPFTISFNKNGTAVAVGCKNFIKIFEFKNKQLYEKFQINAYSEIDNVNFLKFLKKRNHLISIGSDQKIIIWDHKNLQQWEKLQILEGHCNFIRCCCINSEEDLMVTGSSGSSDNSIIFWKLKDKWIKEQQQKCDNSVWSLSLSPSSQKLISAEDKNIINLFEYQNNKWKFIEKIIIECDSIRLCFVSENEFVTQLWKEQYLSIYRYNNGKNSFIKSYDIQVKKSNSDEAYFPIIYIKQKKLLIVKNCKYLNILSQDSDNNFKLNQSIELNSFKFYGDVTDDGKYLIIWDYVTKEYQIRELE